MYIFRPERDRKQMELNAIHSITVPLTSPDIVSFPIRGAKYAMSFLSLMHKAFRKSTQFRVLIFRLGPLGKRVSSDEKLKQAIQFGREREKDRSIKKNKNILTLTHL